MQYSDAPSGVSGDVSRDGGDVPSREVAGFHGPEFMVPPAHGSDLLGISPTPVKVYFNGEDKFAVTFGLPGGGPSTSFWTTEDGVVAIIKACHATLDRARAEKRAAAIEASS